jgi:hypothetical protein
MVAASSRTAPPAGASDGAADAAVAANNNPAPTPIAASHPPTARRDLRPAARTTPRSPCATVPIMAELHTALAWIAVVGAVAVVAAALPTAAGRTASYRLLDLAILGLILSTAVAALTGLLLLLLGHRPSEGLHFLYAAVALAAIPIARYGMRDRSVIRMARFVALAGVIVLVSIARLFMTG